MTARVYGKGMKAYGRCALSVRSLPVDRWLTRAFPQASPQVNDLLGIGYIKGRSKDHRRYMKPDL